MARSAGQGGLQAGPRDVARGHVGHHRGRGRLIDFTQSAPRVARRLIGSTLLIGGVGGVIVETEAYDEADEASHAYGGVRPRSAALFGPPGRAYIYRSYGLHWCLNFVCREEGHGAGVLIRALEPTTGIDTMISRRGLSDPRLLCSGPGRLCEALAVTDALLGKRLDRAPFRLLPGIPKPRIAVGARIGITKAVDTPWRFGLAGSRFLSKPFRATAEPVR